MSAKLAALTAILSTLTFGGVWFGMSPADGASQSGSGGLTSSRSFALPIYYPNCGAARAAGAAPLKRGERGYRAGLDRDGDGVACEPYREGGGSSGRRRRRR
ncbi:MULTISPECIES: excalibur calcium-binding domain-containing protein [unclassified Sphingomonas]|jgi:hypothetical protein|uniref:excalibur calcium-binding domain-containing protein n=1 Tax=unclassified Sphingomonas TaxID=196159 RepID=UPI000B235735|nr:MULTISPECIES: excalibur calcium-binding domain-containing protein [unclassified Sphingomonas]